MSQLGTRPATSPKGLLSQHVRWPVLSAEDKNSVLQVLERGILSGPFAPEVTQLEKEFANYLGSKHCLATNSGTAALHIALAAAGVGPGDEVLVPAFTFIATALAVLHQNAIPIFVDIEPNTLGMDPTLLEATITEKTKAIVPVHIHGTPCNYEAIQAIAKKYQLVIIEDACQAPGAEYRGKKAGSLGDIGTFSLQSSKNLACGEGGLLVTDNDLFLSRACRARMFGENIQPSDIVNYQIDRPLDMNRAYDSVTMGWMYRTNEMSAALARTQLKRLDYWNENARKNAEYLSQALSRLPGITPPIIPLDRTSCFHKYRVRIDARPLGISASPRLVRDALLKALKAEGVDAVLWQTKPVPAQTLFQEKRGFGNGYPWTLSRPVNYDISHYPETVRLLDSSICLFSHTFPIAAQSHALCEAYVEVFTKIWNNLDAIVAAASPL